MSIATSASSLVPKQGRAAAIPTAERGRARTAFLLLLPSLIGVVLFLIVPVLMVIFLSLTRWNLLTPLKWVGLSNYVNIFRFDGMGNSLLVTAYYVLLNIPVQTVVALGLAMVLRNKRPGTGLIRIICVLPFLATPVAILERAERIWVSDMTDALARQAIQRWTGQLVPPEYCGAHVSAPVSHQTGRTLPLAMRAATALFGHFGIEWDLTTASPADLAELGGWIRLYQRHRALIHSGTVLRLDADGGPPGGGAGGGGAAGGSPAGQPAFRYGVLARDRAAALLSYVQLDEPRHTQAAALRVRGLDPGRSYRVTEVTPEASRSGRRPVLSAGPVPGAVLSQIGIALPVQHPYTAVVLLVEAAGPAVIRTYP